MIFKTRYREFDLGSKPVIMGILNVTPDSFSDGGAYIDTRSAIERAEEMVREGADIIDIGGESSRPGSIGLGVQEELDRVIPVIEGLSAVSDICISIDTYKPEVARTAVKAGAGMINCIKGADPHHDLLKEAAVSSAGLCLMHMRGIPENMQKDTYYSDVVDEIVNILTSSAGKAVEAGVASESILLDPGIGFGKDAEGNFRLLRELERFNSTGYGILVGTSRKSFINSIYRSEPSERVPGTIASNVIALKGGAGVFRVHDVKEHRQALDLTYSILTGKL